MTAPWWTSPHRDGQRVPHDSLVAAQRWIHARAVRLQNGDLPPDAYRVYVWRGVILHRVVDLRTLKPAEEL